MSVRKQIRVRNKLSAICLKNIRNLERRIRKNHFQRSLVVKTAILRRRLKIRKRIKRSVIGKLGKV